MQTEKEALMKTVIEHPEKADMIVDEASIRITLVGDDGEGNTPLTLIIPMD